MVCSTLRVTVSFLASQVLSFYYRYMATGDPISYLLGTSEVNMSLALVYIMSVGSPFIAVAH